MKSPTRLRTSTSTAASSASWRASLRPAWQFTLIDSTFDGQREAAIRENEAGLTLVHDEFRNVPTAVSIDPHYSDQLWIKDSRFENITGPAVVISNDASRMTEINFENVLCSHVPIFAKLRESGREFRQVADTYQVSVFSHGLSLAYPGAQAAFRRAMSLHHSPLCRPRHRLRSARCLTPPPGSTFTPSASKATAIPMIRSRCRRRLTSTRCSTSPAAAICFTTRSRFVPIPS